MAKEILIHIYGENRKIKVQLGQIEMVGGIFDFPLFPAQGKYYKEFEITRRLLEKGVFGSVKAFNAAIHNSRVNYRFQFQEGINYYLLGLGCAHESLDTITYTLPEAPVYLLQFFKELWAYLCGNDTVVIQLSCDTLTKQLINLPPLSSEDSFRSGPKAAEDRKEIKLLPMTKKQCLPFRTTFAEQEPLLLSLAHTLVNTAVQQGQTRIADVLQTVISSATSVYEINARLRSIEVKVSEAGSLSFFFNKDNTTGMSNTASSRLEL